MKSFFIKITVWAKHHKKMSILGLVVLVGLGYGAVKIFSDDVSDTRYVLAAVERGSILSSVSGSGQVSASNQVTLSAKASGDIISLNVKAGQEVKAGAVIAQMDSGDAYYDLETARLSYNKLVTVDPTSLRNAENALTDAERNLEDAYVNVRTDLSSAFTDMTDVMEGLKALYNCNTGYLSGCKIYAQSDTKREYQSKGEASWYDADKQIREFTDKYQTISKSSSKDEIESAITQIYGAVFSVSEAAKRAQDAIVWFRDHLDSSSSQEKTQADAAYNTIVPLVSSANSVVSKVTSARNSITSNKRAFENAKTSLDDLRDGPDALDLRSSELSVRQKQEAVSNYVVRAPFDGVVASVAAKIGDSVNNGATIATLITKQKVAEISLNEIDAAKVAVGQKATLTFDAYEDLTITGEVAEVDSIGTVSQGVVSYKVKISFDVDDDKVKPGMSVSASIVTEIKQDILVVPISAVKTQSGASYVETVEKDLSSQTNQAVSVTLSVLPTRVPVVTGISNDESVEIVSGLAEGDRYVARTVTATAAVSRTTASAPSLLGGGAVKTGGGATFIK